MSLYKEFEEKVFNWLMAKNKKDPSFTFSLRQKAAKGAETDYFIGTENSNYFGTTFWTIPIAYPSAAVDLIDIMFQLTKTGYSYYIAFKQTKSPHNNQNKAALQLIQKIKPTIQNEFPKFYDIRPEGNMEYYTFDSPKEEYATIEELIKDIEIDLMKLIPIVDKGIEEVKKLNPKFEAGRITKDDFQYLLDKFEARKNKYANAATPEQKQTTGIVKVSKSDHNLNQILFGPPGTGKTYNTINKAISILNPSFNLNEDRDVIKEEYEQLKRKERVLFTTFHQSMSYEDFVEGIKPLAPKPNETLNYEIQAGIFKIACARAAYLCHKKFLKHKGITNENNNFDDLYFSFVESIKQQVGEKKYPVLKTFKGKEVEIFEINSQNSIKARAKGSVTVNVAPLTKENLEKLYNKFDEVEEILSLEEVREATQVDHRTTEFYAVFKGIKDFEKIHRQSILNNNDDELNDTLPDKEKVIKFDSGVYKDAIVEFGEEAEPVVLIIDEINRGNVSQIFGELITLIEEDKRLGNAEGLEVILPYSKSMFGVPPNLYIIGTMNTADRSVEALDTALRRRFVFEEMPPNPDLLTSLHLYSRLLEKNHDLDWESEKWISIETEFNEIFKPEFEDQDLFDKIIDELIKENKYSEIPTKLKQKVSYNGIGIDQLLNTINKRIERLLSKDHLIGHSFFINVFSYADLQSVFYSKLIPLLQEYFYGDFGKIGLILGNGFITIKEDTNEENVFADFDYEASNEYSEKEIFEIIDYRNPSIDYTIKGVKMDFKKAIDLLLNNKID